MSAIYQLPLVFGICYKDLPPRTPGSGGGNPGDGGGGVIETFRILTDPEGLYILTDPEGDYINYEH